MVIVRKKREHALLLYLLKSNKKKVAKLHVFRVFNREGNKCARDTRCVNLFYTPQDVLKACAHKLHALHMFVLRASACCSRFCRKTRVRNADNEP